MSNKLGKRRTCGHEVSAKAKSCPNCGERKPAKKPMSKKIKYPLLALLGFIAFDIVRDADSIPSSNTSSSSAVRASPPANDWMVLREQSEMDDSATLKVQKDANAPVEAWLKNVTPALRIQCLENKTNVLFIAHTDFTPILGEYGKAALRVRIDDGPVSQQLWGESTDGEVAFAPDPVNFLRKIQNAKILRIEFNPFNSTLATAEFDLTGLKPHLEEVSKTCKWKL